MLLLYIYMEIINLIQDIKEKVTLLENLIKDNSSTSNSSIQLQHVDLKHGTNEDKLRRIVEQIMEYNINIIPTAEDSQIVRAAIAATLGDIGFSYWTKIRQQKENYDFKQQFVRYYSLVKSSSNTVSFGALINRYKSAIDKYNNTNN